MSRGCISHAADLRAPCIRTAALVCARVSWPRKREMRRNLVLNLGEYVDHEAHVRIARERRRLEHALHDDGLHVLIDLQNDDTGKVLARVRLLPQLALALEDVEELVDALKALAVFDRAAVSRGRTVDEHLTARDGHHRSIHHVHRILRLGQVDSRAHRRLARRAERHEQEYDRDDEEVDHARERQGRVHAASTAAGDALLHELQADMVHQPPAGLYNGHRLLSIVWTTLRKRRNAVASVRRYVN